MKDVDFITTLSGYVHWKLTGKKVISVGDASGMFPIDSETKTYHAGMMEKFDALVAGDGYSWRLGEILPEVLVAGQQAGALTEEGARFWILPESLKPALSCVRRKATRAPAWWPPTAWRRIPAMFPPAPLCSL